MIRKSTLAIAITLSFASTWAVADHIKSSYENAPLYHASMTKDQGMMKGMTGDHMPGMKGMMKMMSKMAPMMETYSKMMDEKADHTKSRPGKPQVPESKS